MQVWNVLHVARWKYRMQKWCKKLISAHHHTTLSSCVSQLRHISTIGKKLVKQQYLLQMSPRYGKLWPTNSWDWLASLGYPAHFNGFRILASLLQLRRSLEANQTLHDVWPSPRLVHYVHIFVGFCPLAEFCRVQNSLCIQVLHSRILTALLHGTPAVGMSQTLRHGTRNGITELSPRAPRGWAAIMLGISPHSSVNYGRPM